MVMKVDPPLAQGSIIERFGHGREIGVAPGQIVVGGRGSERAAVILLRLRLSFCFWHVRLNPYFWAFRSRIHLQPPP
jgi:hypothetical protein